VASPGLLACGFLSMSSNFTRCQRQRCIERPDRPLKATCATGYRHTHWLPVAAAGIAYLGLLLQGCTKTCQPEDVCEMRRLCHYCCNDDQFDPDPRCFNYSTVPAPIAESENAVCNEWCDTKCPDEVKGNSDPGACVAPARMAARDTTAKMFGKVHTHDPIKRLRGNGRKKFPMPINNTAKGCMWRQTSDCRANGPREPQNDQDCDEVVESGKSGYCECYDPDGGVRRAYEADCRGKAPFTCKIACSGLCAWHQTAGCDPEGEREPDNDRECGDRIPAGISGYCECGEDKQHTHGAFCDKSQEPFSCLEACSALLIVEDDADL